MQTHTRSRSTTLTVLVGALTLLLIAATSAAPARAIVIRHDRDAARYLELGSRYPSVCKVGRQMGDGTLVSPRHILTAAHVARGLNGSPDPVVTCEGTDYAVQTIFKIEEMAIDLPTVGSRASRPDPGTIRLKHHARQSFKRFGRLFPGD